MPMEFLSFEALCFTEKKFNMTIQHIFYIPTIFLLGVVFGTMISHRKRGVMAGASMETTHQNDRSLHQTSSSKLIQTFLVFLLVFAATHIFEIPWGPKAISQLLGDQEIFDRKPSFSGTEVYERLNLFPADGLITYKRFTYTVDIVFPLSFLIFLFTFARYVSQRIAIPKYLTTVLIALPFLWFACDLTENAVIFSILSMFPEQNEFLSGSLGYITATKFALLLISLFTPSLLFLLGKRSIKTG